VPTSPTEVLAVGALFPMGAFSYTVHSEFASAVNWRVEGQPFLVSLVTKPEALHPRSALVTRLPGDGGHWDDPGPVARHDGTMPFLPLGSALVQRRIGLVEAHLRVLKARKGLGEDAFSLRLDQGALLLQRSFAQGAAALVGFGPGLTPAGDDYLTGFVAARWSQGSGMACKADLLPLLSRTNAVSAAFLASAAEGLFSDSLVNLALSLGRGGTAWKTALSVLGDQGHSSGLDAASGFVHGLRS